ELGAIARLHLHTHEQLPAVILIGSEALCARYSHGLTVCGFPQVTLAEQATERGLWQVAVQAGLIARQPSQHIQEV
ncbi:2-dehydro-3-deoxygalactonokinase, partial [Pseudomonas syringae pv. actinidiae]